MARALSLATAVTLGLTLVAGPAADASAPAAERQAARAQPRAASDRCFIGVSHQIFLDRPATEAEKIVWSDRFDAGTPKYRLPQEQATSDEWLTVVVTGLYQDALDRDPDAAGLAHWIGELRAGALVNRVASLIYGSAEFDANAGGTTAGFVTDIYTRILGRAPDEAGRAYWEGQVATRGRGRVAALFFASVESRGDRVDGLYDQILGRPADASGRQHWIDQLANVNDVRLAILLASGREAIERAPNVCSTTIRIADGNGDSEGARISADGRHLVFESRASDLVPGPRQGHTDVFTHDIASGATTRITDGDADSGSTDISADGRYVTFHSVATDLVPGDTNGRTDVFTWDRTTGITMRITNGDDDSGRPVISTDGRHIAFVSLASDLVPGDDDVLIDIFTWDRNTGATSRITDGSSDPFVGHSVDPDISADGDHIAFTSFADLLPGDANSGGPDVFTWSRATGTTTRITGAHGESQPAFISADGGHVVFHSTATDLLSETGDGEPGLHVWDRSTRSVRLLAADSGRGSDVAVAGDGSRIAFDSLRPLPPDDANGESDLVLWDEATGSFTLVTNGADDFTHPTMTPAGDRIAYSATGSPLVSGDARDPADVFVWTDLG